MTSRLRRLDVRLFVSYAIVAVVCAVTFSMAFRYAAGQALQNHLDSMPRTSRPNSEMAALHSDTEAAVRQSFTGALPVALFAGLAAAGLTAAFVSRRILRPISQLRTAARRLADGHFDERVPSPPEPELAGLAADLNRLAAGLQTTEQRRHALVADVSHELRTPLTTIEGVTQGLIDGIFEPTTETYEMLLDETARLRRLAHDLGTLNRLDATAELVHPTPADPTTLTRQIIDAMRPQFDLHDITLNFDGAGGLVCALDVDRYRQILTNLLDNALAYTTAGGTVNVTTGINGPAIEIRVADNGIGLAPDDTSRIFERFYRVPAANRPPGGTGIGLTIARQLARAHHGDLTCTSPGPGLGSTFTITLPAQLGVGSGVRGHTHEVGRPGRESRTKNTIDPSTGPFHPTQERRS